VARNVLVLLLGTNDGRAADLYQDLQGKTAQARGEALGVHVEVVFCSASGQYRVILKRLGETAAPLDAVVTEPATVASMELILKDLKSRTGLVLLNAWDPLAETYFGQWSPGFPIGAISMPHDKFGELQGKPGMAIDLLHRFWAEGHRLPKRSFTDVVPYPLSRGGA
jgi:hypothetical protein